MCFAGLYGRYTVCYHSCVYRIIQRPCIPLYGNEVHMKHMLLLTLSLLLFLFIHILTLIHTMLFLSFFFFYLSVLQVLARNSYFEYSYRHTVEVATTKYIYKIFVFIRRAAPCPHGSFLGLKRGGDAKRQRAPHSETRDDGKRHLRPLLGAFTQWNQRWTVHHARASHVTIRESERGDEQYGWDVGR